MSLYTRLLQSLVFAFACATAAHAAEPVDINHADAKTLAAGLKGVGQSRAEAIVAYREEHGPYASVDDLEKVTGIGKKTVEANRSLMRVGPAPQDPPAAAEATPAEAAPAPKPR